MAQIFSLDRPAWAQILPPPLAPAMFCNFEAEIHPTELVAPSLMALSRSVGITRFLFTPPHRPREIFADLASSSRPIQPRLVGDGSANPRNPLRAPTEHHIAWPNRHSLCAPSLSPHLGTPKTFLRYALANYADLVRGAGGTRRLGEITQRSVVLYNPELCPRSDAPLLACSLALIRSSSPPSPIPEPNSTTKLIVSTLTGTKSNSTMSSDPAQRLPTARHAPDILILQRSLLLVPVPKC
ncbi:hypothetical protein HMN09_00391600 [Mycena chlorophos]|uniref:Uncharacterized protein n=1 Tax=Mycena chlorophos TaxID=658473 RepID=A0A8H6WH40_MYCCL|nr:hypothetical protein HMN09_00391600 [Mycena chlorophos]